jgi:hypothetical protein
MLFWCRHSHGVRHCFVKERAAAFIAWIFGKIGMRITRFITCFIITTLTLSSQTHTRLKNSCELLTPSLWDDDGIRPGWPRFDSQQGQKILSSNRRDRLGGFTHHLNYWIVDGKRPGSEPDHAPPDSVQAKSGGAHMYNRFKMSRAASL